MAQQSQSSKYTHGYSEYTLATHQRRTAESDAAFLLPHIRKTDYILDAGCGPGTITTGLAKYASEGKTIGLDISPDVLRKAKALANKANIPPEGPGSVAFEQGNILERLPYPDSTFDVIFCCQVFGHLEQLEKRLQALAELRRVLKPGGLLATRDAAAQHFYPERFNLDQLWGRNQARALQKGSGELETIGGSMPALFRRAGFDADGGKVLTGAGTTVFCGLETRQWLAWRTTGQLQEGDQFRQSWLDAGITEDEIQQTLSAVKEWAKTTDAWFASLQCEMLGWK
ncbi:S-adenosyl-L-methionine-dependent methyltransferase [Xylariales sp. PMI_506]|nr:S-adenosyl-L-methionine-dependent methyltransferase [Xylariales sp. PMI_506]